MEKEFKNFKFPNDLTKHDFNIDTNVSIETKGLKKIFQDMMNNLKYTSSRFLVTFKSDYKCKDTHDELFKIFLNNPSENKKNKFMKYCNENNIKVNPKLLDEVIMSDKISKTFQESRRINTMMIKKINRTIKKADKINKPSNQMIEEVKNTSKKKHTKLF